MTVLPRPTRPLENPVSDSLLRLAVATKNRVEGPDRERGDVPGWVMITLMTAGLVTAIWAFAGPALERLFTGAVADVQVNRPG